jgi:hypothetical protein
MTCTFIPDLDYAAYLREQERRTTRRPVTALFERADPTAPSPVDRDRGIIHSVKIIGRVSKNNREYTDNALNQLRELCEGADVHIDHPQLQDAHADRSLSTKFGMLKQVRMKSDGLYGDLHYLTAHPMAEQICEAAEKMPSNFGMSINAEGDVTPQNGKNVVDQIHKLRSVDLVSRPGATNGLFEDVAGDEDQPMQEGDDLQSKILDILDDDGDNSSKAARIAALFSGTQVPDGQALDTDDDPLGLDLNDPAAFAKAIAGKRTSLRGTSGQVPTDGIAGGAPSSTDRSIDFNMIGGNNGGPRVGNSRRIDPRLMGAQGSPTTTTRNSGGTSRAAGALESFCESLRTPRFQRTRLVEATDSRPITIPENLDEFCASLNRRTR